MTSTIRKEKRN